MKIIKRYSNRKLYDTDARRYTNFDTLAGIIRGGETIKVVAHDTGADMTVETLAQIVAKEASFSPDLPTSPLYQVIRCTVPANSLRASSAPEPDPQG